MSTEEITKKRALIISVANYEDPDLEDLSFCENDGETMYHTLKEIGYNIPEDCYLVGNVNYGKMKKSIINFFQNIDVNYDDTLLFYFSGHGVLDGYGGKFFSTTQTNTEFPEEHGISFNFLTEQMRKSNSEKKVAILDCCFSGETVAPTTGKSSSKGIRGEKEAEIEGRNALM